MAIRGGTARTSTARRERRNDPCHIDRPTAAVRVFRASHRMENSRVRPRVLLCPNIHKFGLAQGLRVPLAHPLHPGKKGTPSHWGPVFGTTSHTHTYRSISYPFSRAQFSPAVRAGRCRVQEPNFLGSEWIYWAGRYPQASAVGTQKRSLHSGTTRPCLNQAILSSQGRRYVPTWGFQWCSLCSTSKVVTPL